MPPLAIEQIEELVERADLRERRFRMNCWLFSAMLMAFGAPFIGAFRAALWTHREFLWGILIGSLAELAIILISRWSWDRVLWQRWFSR